MNTITDLIVWLSPVLAGIIAWFLNDLISDVKSSIKEVDESVKFISRELVETQKTVVEIKTDMKYLKEDTDNNKKYNSDFENKVVTILREVKSRYK